MKAAHHSKLIAVIAAVLMLGASPAQAFVVNWLPVGLAFGQTARVNLLNTSESAIIIIGGKFLDADGSVLGEFRDVSIPPGKTMSFDLNREAAVPTDSFRVQLHLQLEGEAGWRARRGPGCLVNFGASAGRPWR